jgi:2',3'-cyclic-nucleotide 2'-phosphodiesterase/3'-nucleotidase
MRVINQVVSGSPLAALPLLSAASSPASGGISGADHFVDLPAGEIQRRHIAGLAPFANQVWAVRINGQQLLDWLEKSAQVFHVLHREAPDQMLLDPTVPGYHCDSMHGITYEIDPTVRPQFDARQIPLPGTPRRVGSAFWKSQPIRPDQEFLVATSHYRASGGGGFEAITEGCETLRSTVMQDEALTRYLEAPDCDEIRSDRPWRFRPGLNVSAILETSPEALTHLSDISHLKPEPCGATQDGFARIRVHL